MARVKPAAIAVLLAAVLAGCGSSAPPKITVGAARTYRLAGFSPAQFAARTPARLTFSSASARVGPGPVTETVNMNGYRLELRVSPNRAAVPNSFSVRINRAGQPVRGAEVVSGITMLDIEMGSQSYVLTETSPGVYSRSAPALVMVGHWGLSFEVTPAGKAPFTVLLVDRANG